MTLWNLEKERKEKRTREHYDIVKHNIRGEGRGYKDVY
jgi:hypothetical protein